ncbi:MAG: transglycosylase domain-containing protein [Fimbriimonadales bacterium]
MAAKNPPAKAGPVKRVKAKAKSPLWWRWLKRGFALVTLIILIGGIAVGFLFAGELKRASEMMSSLPSVLESVSKKASVIVGADGKELYHAMAEFRRPVAYDHIPKLVINATIAAEDKRFWEHSGIDFWAMPRVILNAGKKGGGSTLTMQLAKRVYTSPEKSVQRKVRDMALAMMIEREKTKPQILELYLNQVYYGSGAFGIQAAAEVYFGKTLDQLTIAETALLARCVRRPSDENPYANLDAAIANRNVVLGIMREEGMITGDEYEHAMAERVRLKPRSFGSGAKIVRSPYFVQYVLDQVKHDLPEIDLTTGGYRIETTLNTEMDDYAQRAVRRLVDRNRKRKVTTAAFVLMDSNGQIKAMAGGYDYRRNQFNVIYQGRRQPGSSFKPFVYATALSRGVIRPTDTISNEKFTWRDPASGKVWEPKNSSGGYGGSFSVRSAIALSKNVPAVRVCEAVGPDTVVSYAHSAFGFESELTPVLSLGLGSSAVSPLEMAQAYSVFQSGGNRVKPFGILRVIGPDGTVLKSYEPEIAQNVFDPQVAAEMDGFLRAVVMGGTGKEARSIEGARGKTGTTQDNRDAWFCGYTNRLIGIGWIANEHFDNGRKRWVYDPMPKVFGGTVTVDLWVDVMKKASEVFGTGGEYKERHPERAVDPMEQTDPNPVDDVSPGGDEMPQGAPANEPPPVDEPPQTTPPGTGNSGTEPPKETTPPRNETETETVEICADSRLLATPYCPETVAKSFPKGKAPKKRCPIHGG